MKPIRIAALVVAGAAVVAFAGVGRPDSAGGAAKPSGGITVNGTGTITSVPDEATFTVGVQTQGSTAREALAANSEQMRRVIAAVRSAGVAKDESRPGCLRLRELLGGEPDRRLHRRQLRPRHDPRHLIRRQGARRGLERRCQPGVRPDVQPERRGQAAGEGTSRSRRRRAEESRGARGRCGSAWAG